MRRRRTPGARTARRARNKAARAELRCRAESLTPRALYGGCLAYAIGRGSAKAAGFAAYIFKEITESWPQPRDRGPPAWLPDALIEEWMELPRQSRIIKAAKPAPLLAPIEHPKPQVDANGFVEGTLMTREDFEEQWR